MIEQLTMFSDPLEERALETLRAVAEQANGIERAFNEHYGGCRKDYNFCFNPTTKVFYYSDKSFNNYMRESYVRRKTLEEIKQLFPEE